jgi:hypothetical protein
MNRRSFLSRCLAAAATVVARAYAPAALVAPKVAEPVTVIHVLDWYETDFGMVAVDRHGHYVAEAAWATQKIIDAFERRLWYGAPQPPRLNRWQRRQRRLARRS